MSDDTRMFVRVHVGNAETTGTAPVRATGDSRQTKPISRGTVRLRSHVNSAKRSQFAGAMQSASAGRETSYESFERHTPCGQLCGTKPISRSRASGGSPRACQCETYGTKPISREAIGRRSGADSAERTQSGGATQRASAGQKTSYERFGRYVPCRQWCGTKPICRPEAAVRSRRDCQCRTCETKPIPRGAICHRSEANSAERSQFAGPTQRASAGQNTSYERFDRYPLREQLRGTKPISAAARVKPRPTGCVTGRG